MQAVNVVAAPERFNASLLLDRNVDRGRAGKAAVHAVDRSLTYGELLAQASRAGNLLRALGVAPGGARAARPRRHDRVPRRVPRRDAARRRPGPGEPARQGRQLPPLRRRQLRARRGRRRREHADAPRGARRPRPDVRLGPRPGGGRDRPRGRARRPGRRARPGRDAPRRHGVLAVQLGLDRPPEGRRPPPPRHRDHVRDLRPAGPRRARGRRAVLDDEAPARLRPGQQPVVPAALRRDRGAQRGAAEARHAARRPARAPPDDLLLRAGAVRRAGAGGGGGGRVRLGADVRLGRRGAVAHDLRPLPRPLRPRDRRRHRLDRDAPHLLLERPGRGRPRQHRAAGAGLRAADPRRGRRRRCRARRSATSRSAATAARRSTGTSTRRRRRR